MSEGNERKQEKESGTEKREKNAVLQLLDSVDWRNKNTYFRIGKTLLFVFMLVIESFVLIPQAVAAKRSGSYVGVSVVTLACVALTASETVRLAALKKFRAKLWCYAVDCVAMLLLTAVTGSTYLSTLYMIILTEYYMSAERTIHSVACFLVALCMYIATFWISSLIRETGGSGVWVLAQTVSDLMILSVHFIVVTVATRFYRQSQKLSETLRKLDESNRELEKAYENLAEVTALQERQRIAKDIHDTAGHSITTVIMQTEAAKLVIDKNPTEAKNKIVAANLQAKHALEELRESVHLLSGVVENASLKESLLSIVHESTDGTGVAIRADIDEVSVSSAKARFLCNSLKEGIANGLRHGGATAFYFELKNEENGLRFLLSDNGAAAKMPFQKGFGLTGMEERARSFGGEAEFRADEEGGFEVEIHLPFDGVREGEEG